MHVGIFLQAADRAATELLADRDQTISELKETNEVGDVYVYVWEEAFLFTASCHHRYYRHHYLLLALPSFPLELYVPMLKIGISTLPTHYAHRLVVATYVRIYRFWRPKCASWSSWCG
jgi:hypothetical protein